jgi:hypothetical protein
MFCVLMAGCDAASTSLTGPAPGSTDDTTFTLAGRVQNGDGAPVSGAAVHLDGPAGRQTALSDEGGEYRISGLRGRFAMTVTRDDYGVYTNTVFVAADQRFDITLHHLSPVTLTAGVTLRGTIQGQLCGAPWDEEFPCVTVHFTPPATGTYELLLTWKGPSGVDLFINGALYMESYTGEIRVDVQVPADVPLVMRIHAYHVPPIAEPFELTAALKSGS